MSGFKIARKESSRRKKSCASVEKTSKEKEKANPEL